MAGSAVILGNQVYTPYGTKGYIAGSMGTSKGYTGQYEDPTGLDYYNARYYDPVIAQFITVDVKQDNLHGFDPYAYVLGNPETKNDPTGHDGIAIDWPSIGSWISTLPPITWAELGAALVSLAPELLIAVPLALLLVLSTPQPLACGCVSNQPMAMSGSGITVNDPNADGGLADGIQKGIAIIAAGKAAQARSKSITVQNQGNFNYAVGWLEVIEQEPSIEHEWWLVGGGAEVRLKLFAEALAIYDQVIALDPVMIPAFIQKGRLLSFFDREEEAQEVFQQTLRAVMRMAHADPKNAHAYLYQGDALLLLHREEEALKAYNQAIVLAPNDPDAYVNKGWLLYILPGAEALDAYDQALHLAPDDPDIYYKKGLVLFEMRCYEEDV